MSRLMRFSAVVLFAGLMCAVPALADPFPNVYYWNLDTPGNVGVADNWIDWNGNPSAVVPGAGHIAVFKKPGVATISSTSLFTGVLNDIWVGDGSTTTQWPEGPLDPGPGNVLQTSGAVQYANWLVIGRAGQTGVYDLQGGSIAQTGVGTGQFRVGEGVTGNGTLNLSNNASVTVNDFTLIGIEGTGKVTLQNSAMLSVLDYCEIGHSGGSGVLEMSGDTKATFDAMEVGWNGGHGVIKLSGNAELKVNGWSGIGQNGGDAEITMSGNSKYYGFYGRLGEAGGNGNVTLTMKDSARLQWGAWFAPGAETSTCTMTLNDSAVIQAGATDFSWGQAGVANVTMNQSSSIVANSFSLATHAVAGNPSHGTLILNSDASISAGDVYIGHVYGEATVYMNGNSSISGNWVRFGEAYGKATVYMNDSSHITSSGAIAIAQQEGGQATIHMTGSSTMNAASWLAIGNCWVAGSASGYGEVFMSGNAQINCGDHLEIAFGGTGILHIGANPGDNAVVRSQAGPLYLGYGAASADTHATINLNRGGTLETHGIMTGKDPDYVGPLSSILNLNGGILRALVDDPDFMTNAGAAAVFQANVQRYGAVVDTNGFDIGLNVPLTEDPASPGGGLTKLGAGVLTLGGANTYTGATSIVAGGLAINGSITSDVTVAPDAALLGSGLIDGDVAAAGTVAPGTSIGTLTIDGDLALSGTLDVEYESDTGACDRLVVSGKLDLTGATLSFEDVGVGGYSGPYIIATYGTLVGDPATEIGLPPGLQVVYTYGGNSIAVVPEPSLAVLLVALASALLLGRRADRRS